MNDFKFRVWNVRDKRHQTFDGFKSWGMILSAKSDTVSSIGSGMLLLTDNPEYFIWEQRVIKDDTGAYTDVYENDIVKIGDDMYVVADKNFEYVHRNDCERWGYEVMGTDHDRALHMLYIGDESGLRGLLHD